MLYEQLRRSLCNERVAPEVLPFKSNIISTTNKWVDYLETEIAIHYPPNSLNEFNQLRLKRYLQELSRLKYILSSYYKSRLQKIQHFVLHYSRMLEQNITRNIFSNIEETFIKEYETAWTKHMNSCVTDYLPIQFQGLLHQVRSKESTPPDMGRRPDLDRHVIFRALEDLNDIDDKEDVKLEDIEKGSRWVCRYSTISPLLQEDKIELI